MISNGSGSIKAGILFLIPMVISLGLLIMFSNTWSEYKSSALPAQGRVTYVAKSNRAVKTRVVQGHTSYIEGVYTVDGTEYTVYTSYDGFIRKGQKLTYYYPPGMPENGKPAPVGAFAITGIAAAFFGFLGAAGLFFGIKERKAFNRFMADCGEISFDTWEEIDANPTAKGSQLKCCLFSFNDPSGEVFKFHSESYNEGKCPYIKGVPVSVYVDTDNPRRYYIRQDSKKFKK